MNSGVAATADVSELQRARGREKATYLWIRVLGAAAIACLAAWGLRKYSTLLFGGAGCEAGHSTGVPDLREFEE